VVTVGAPVRFNSVVVPSLTATSMSGGLTNAPLVTWMYAVTLVAAPEKISKDDAKVGAWVNVAVAVVASSVRTVSTASSAYVPLSWVLIWTSSVPVFTNISP